ncbi:2-phospho-L-lactate guanylyltransferase [Dermacoccaceae bacterium W4C1]
MPVKSRFRAKTRLLVPDGVDKPALALALALDTLDAVLSVVRADRVIVVTEDDQVSSAMAARGVSTVPDPARGLNQALRVGLDEAIRRDASLPTAVLLGDLPALRPQELAAALRACAATESALVPDHDGEGTVLMTHHDPAALSPRFGRGSAARHARRCTVLELDLPTVRHDVDDLDSLERVQTLGVGQHTAAALGPIAATA